MTRARFSMVAAALALTGQSLAAQAARYLPQPDTLVITTRNPFRMFYVRGADTLGNRVFARGITRAVWRAQGDSIVVDEVRRDLTFSRKDTSHHIVHAPNGRAIRTDGHSQYGLPSHLMPLPEAPLRAGLAWRDSSVIARDSNGFAVRFEWIMTYRVARIFDSLGGRIADVSAEGRYRMRDQFGDTAGKRQWIDVRGPDHETFLFDITHGRQLARTWDMKLRGWGGGRLPGDSVAHADSVPAGLDSKTFDRLLPREEWGIVGYRQEGRDTSVTVTVPDGGIAGVHVIDRGGDSVVSTHIRADGEITLERAAYAGGMLVHYERAWADTALRGMRERFSPKADSLIATRSDGVRSAYPSAVAAIAAADVGHEELLVPLMMHLPADGPGTPVAVFRPSFRRFDYAEASRRRIKGGWLVKITWERGTAPDAWLVSDNGDLLFIEARSDEHTRRVPGQVQRVKEMTTLAESLKTGS